jgi:subtilisin-like proprotein convertase family protein
MKFIKTMPLLSALLSLLTPASAQVMESYMFSGLNLPIPDVNPVGTSDTQQIGSTLSIAEIKASLTITGSTAFTGDFYAYLGHNSQIAVLLNRVGRSDSNPFGYNDAGIQATFYDSAVNGDVHNYRLTLTGSHSTPVPSPGVLTGEWAPDGRNISPASVQDMSPRTATLSSFIGTSAAGEWTLFIADLSEGGTGTLTDWSLEIVAVPEPSVAGSFAAILLTGYALYRALGRSSRFE